MLGLLAEEVGLVGGQQVHRNLALPGVGLHPLEVAAVAVQIQLAQPRASRPATSCFLASDRLIPAREYISARNWPNS
jgi:hypothetical protein